MFRSDKFLSNFLYMKLNKAGTVIEGSVFIESAVYIVMKNDLAFVLAGFLRKYRAEVLGMLLEEFDVKKYERSLREEGREEGRQEAKKENERYSELICILLEQHREDDLKRAAKNEKYRIRLYKEFDLF